jgi:NAD(P)-dependent dehydrogenase (short-subunit alcohol dehydrogenase family)
VVGVRRLEDKVALVTGAASGIGRGITERFLAEGAKVVAADIDAEGLAHLVDLPAASSQTLVVSRCDVTDEGDVATTCDLAVSRFGGLDVTVANAGKGAFAPIVDHDLDEWRDVVDLCLTGVFLTVKHAGRVMRDGGSIVTIASLNAVQPSAGMSAYCAAKAGVVAFSRVAAMELGGRGIRVNAIAPGLVETTATGTIFALPGVVEEFVENTTVGRFAQPADVASLAVFLASDESTFVSGSMYLVDGGASTKRYPDLPAAIERLGAV